MKFRTAALAVAFGFGVSAIAGAVTIGFNPRTGDAWVDSELREVNQYGYDDRDYFVDGLVDNFGAPRYLVTDLVESRRWPPGDVYYACALAFQSHRPCGDVVNMYEQDRAHGWGAVAQRLGIKPGSAAFFALKDQFERFHGRFKEHDHGPNGDESIGDSGDYHPGRSGEHGHGGGRGNDNNGGGH
jgi:hypothetical protein